MGGRRIWTPSRVNLAASRGRLGRIRIGAEPPAARDGLRSSRGAATARRDRAAAALGRWGWFGLRDFGFAVCHSARRKVAGGSKGRVRARETVFGFRFQNGENNDGVSRDEWIGRSGFPFSPREGIKGKQNLFSVFFLFVCNKVEIMFDSFLLPSLLLATKNLPDTFVFKKNSPDAKQPRGRSLQMRKLYIKNREFFP